MISLATIVFKSGATVEIPFGTEEAQQLLTYFGENWDEAEPELNIAPSLTSSGCRIVPSEVVGIFVTNAEEGDEDEAEDEDEDEADEDVADEDDDDTDEDSESPETPASQAA